MFLMTGTPRENLARLIAENNVLPSPLSGDQLYFGTIFTQGDEVVVPVVTLYDQPYDGPSHIRYRRVNLSEVFSDIRPIISEVGSPTLHGLLPTINKRLGLDLREDDILNSNIDWLGNNEQVNLLIRARTESLGYQGQFLVQYNRIRPQLGVTVANKALDALNHPKWVDPAKRSLEMCLWGLDFSSEQSLFTVKNGWWVNEAPIKAMLAELGFSNWPSPPKRDYVGVATTAKVPGSNTAFEMVAVQLAVVGPDYAGKALFHFNRA